jgi:hypothetical protein
MRLAGGIIKRTSTALVASFSGAVDGSLAPFFVRPLRPKLKCNKDSASAAICNPKSLFKATKTMRVEMK